MTNQQITPAVLEKVSNEQLSLDMYTLAVQANDAYHTANPTLPDGPIASEAYLDPVFGLYEAEAKKRELAGDPYWIFPSQEQADKIFATDLGQQLDTLYATIDGQFFLRAEEAAQHAVTENLIRQAYHVYDRTY